MALAKKCDRCGKLHEHYPTNDNNVCNSIQSLCVTSCGQVWRSMNRKDLCPECMEAIKAFLSNDAYIVRKVEKGEKLCH